MTKQSTSWTLNPSPSPDSSSVTGALRGLLEALLTSGTVEAVMVQTVQPSSGRPSHALVSRPELLGDALPLSPVMPVSGARMVSRLSARAPERPVAVVLRPCEERALVELIKLKQATMTNVLPVVIDCPGACEWDEASRLAAGPHGLEGATEALLSAACEPGAPGPELRRGCQSCVAFTPGVLAREAGISVELLGRSKAASVVICPELDVDGAALGLSGEEPDGAARARLVDELTASRQESLDQELNALAPLDSSVEAFLDEVASCIRCGACRQACPICFCKRCTFEMPAHDHNGEDFLRWADRKGAARMPEDVALYHMTRLAHVALSCSSCGACESACPQGIRLTRLFSRTGPMVRAPFDGYVPGRSPEEPLPLSVFEAEELEPR